MPDVGDNKADKAAVQEAKAPVWKKILIWGAAILGLVTLIVVLVIMLIRRRTPGQAAKEIIQIARREVAKADMDAKIEVAKAKAKEDAVIEELHRIREIADEEERADRLVELMNRDW